MQLYTIAYIAYIGGRFTRQAQEHHRLAPLETTPRLYRTKSAGRRRVDPHNPLGEVDSPVCEMAIE
jgi:hypothetical protein